MVLAASAQTCTTTITGKVYSPLGPTLGDPIPNILVYVATTPVQPLPLGLTTCAGESQLVTGTPLVTTTTAADGSFSMTSTGLNTIASPVNLVIQAGKWRRQNSVPITPCTTNTVNLSMPSSQAEGDLPHIAVVTGAVDGVECIFRQIGISDTEFTDPSGTGSINLYEGSGTNAGKPAGGAVVNPADNPVPSEASLVESQTNLNSYDLVMFGCQGTATDAIPNSDINQSLENLVSYANTGGRIFATHFGYVWLDSIQPFESSANWIKDQGTITTPGFGSSGGVATIDTSYPEGAVLANWLQNIGASYKGQYGQMELYNIRQDQNAVNNPPAQTWLNLNNYTGNPSMQFTFDTPVNSSGTPTVALTFANSPQIFSPGDPGDDVTINVTDTSNTPADNSLNMTLLLPPGVTATSLAGLGPGTGWICSAATLTCNRTTSLAAGTTDPVLLVLSVALNAPLGDGTITATIAGGGLSGTNQCGRVLYNDYHVETGATYGEKYPAECGSGAITPQEKFLEFSLYNLSNFVAPVTSDVIDIQAPTTLTWPTPTPIPYGTPLSSTQLDATVTITSNGTVVPGTFVYTPAAGAIVNTGSNNTLSVSFTPTDPTSYAPASGSTTLVVTQDTTTTTLDSSINPSVLNESVTFTATVTGSNAAPTGTVNFYDGATMIGSGTLTAGTGDVSTATFSTSILTQGSHDITASYASTTNFGPSASSPPLVQVVNLIPSTTTITGLVSPIYYGQIIGDTAFINVAGFSGGGFSSVYIDNVLVCSLPVTAGTTLSCPATTGAGYNSGTHTIYATYSGDAEYAFSTSPTYNVVILPDVTTTTLISTMNPSKQGQPVTFTATVTAPYANPINSVSFYDGGTLLATVPLANGFASYTTTTLPVGPDAITASYPASLNFDASTSAVLTEQINPLIPRFVITVTPNPIDIVVNTSGTITVTVTELDGFNQPVQLSCTGLPIETNCIFAQTLIPAGGGTIQANITPAPPHSCKAGIADVPMPSGPLSGLWMAVVALSLLFARRRRRLLQGLTLAAALFFLPSINGCGNCTDLGLEPGAYTVTVLGTSTGTPVQTSSAVVTMNVSY